MRKSDNGKGHRIREASIKRRRKKQSRKGKGTYVHNSHAQSKKALLIGTATSVTYFGGFSLATTSPVIPAKQSVDG